MQGLQPFKAVVEGLNVSSYDLYWQVDGGTLNQMYSSNADYPHKEASVDLTGWNWHGAGPYAVTFVAKQNSTVISQKTISIFTGASSIPSVPSAPVVLPSPAPTPIPAPNPPPAPPVTVPATIVTPIVTPAPSAATNATINMWWPTKNVTLDGVQPFKALVPNKDVNAYTMYWQVDGGSRVLMPTSYADAPHKETVVDLTGWNWQPSGTYTLTFTAVDTSGATIATYSEPILVHHNGTPLPAPASTPTPTPAPIVAPPAPTPAPTPNATSFYADPNSPAAAQAAAWAATRPGDAALMRVLAAAPTAKWFGGWSGDVSAAVSTYVNAAAASGKTPILVAYNIPQRDCGGYSAGGATDYRSWITSFAHGIGSNRAIVILEPDALAQIGCLSPNDQSARFTLLSQAVAALASNANTKVYIDAGHAGWVDPSTMAGRLQQSNVAAAAGFSLNVSNYDATASEAAYGSAISTALGNKHFVIDTSRNGNGGNGQWCNAPGRAIGTAPTTQTGIAGADAFLWIKTPGESDGTCNGGPSAGTWWPEYGLGLVRNAPHI